LAGKVVVYYDIIDAVTEHSYNMQLYSSKDNFEQPLQIVEGDVGINIPVGTGKIIIWNANQELGGIVDDQLNLKLKGSLYAPFIVMEEMEKTIFKRGKPREIRWSGNQAVTLSLNFVLYKGEKEVFTFDARPNNGSTELTIPMDIKPGKDYYLKISDAQNSDEVLMTSNFIVKRKVPLGVKVGLGFVVAGVVAYLVSSEPPEAEQKIIPPPLPSR